MNIQKSMGQDGTAKLSSVQVSSENRLSTKPLVIVSALGIFFWFVFAMLIRLTSGLGLLGGSAGVATFLLSIPIAWLTVVVIRGLAKLSADQLVAGVGMSLAAATLCDGIAFTWAPWLMGTSRVGFFWAQATLFGAWA